MSQRLKLTNTSSGVPLVLNASAIISLYANSSNDGCFVVNSNSQANFSTGSTKLVGQFTLAAGQANDFAKELNSALTSNPGGPVLKLHTKATILNYTIPTS